MSNSLAEKREPALDIIRIFAFVFVVSVHFFWHSGFYGFDVFGVPMFFMVIIRSLSMICVPLFLVLTGYLTSDKKICRKYYFKLPHLLAVYFLASLFCVAYNFFIKQNTYTAGQFIGGFLNFTNAPYGWYVEMYIGIFLLCPFLNLMYHGIDTKKKKLLLIFIMILLTSIPTVVNIFKFDLNWFADPSISEEYFKILPDYWLFLYPFTFYFIGCYLKEFGIKMKSGRLFILILCVGIMNGSFAYLRSADSHFAWGPWTQHNGLGQLVMTVLFFAFFKNLNYKNMPGILSAFLKRVSKLTFCAYLVSWVFDDMFYIILRSKEYEMNEVLSFYPVLVPVICICSLIISFFINLFYDMFIKLIVMCKQNIQNKKNNAVPG